VRSEVDTVVVMKNVTPCSLVDIHRHLEETYFLLKIFYDPEDGGNMYFRNVSGILPDYMAFHPRKWYS
jgi:hypothetical protein